MGFCVDDEPRSIRFARLTTFPSRTVSDAGSLSEDVAQVQLHVVKRRDARPPSLARAQGHGYRHAVVVTIELVHDERAVLGPDQQVERHPVALQQ